METETTISADFCLQNSDTVLLQFSHHWPKIFFYAYPRDFHRPKQSFSTNSKTFSMTHFLHLLSCQPKTFLSRSPCFSSQENHDTFIFILKRHPPANPPANPPSHLSQTLSLVRFCSTILFNSFSTQLNRPCQPLPTRLLCKRAFSTPPFFRSSFSFSSHLFRCSSSLHTLSSVPFNPIPTLSHSPNTQRKTTRSFISCHRPAHIRSVLLFKSKLVKQLIPIKLLLFAYKPILKIPSAKVQGVH